MTTRQQGIMLIMFSLVAAVLSVEVSLRVAGFIYKNYRIENRKIIKEKSDNTIKILCLGDSFTFGSGAEKGFSYPEQLQKMLDSDSNKKCVVYNEGAGGQNSSQVLKNLPEQLFKYSPDIAIIMTGLHDAWNLEDSNYYLFSDVIRFKLLYKIDSLLMRFKSYKLFKIAYVSLKVKMIESKIGSMKLKKEINYNIPLRASEKTRLESYIKLADSYWNERSRDRKNATKVLKNALNIDPHSKEVLSRLGDVYACSPYSDLAIKTYKRLIEEEPGNIKTHIELFKLYRFQREFELAKKEAMAISFLDPKNSAFKMLLVTGISSAVSSSGNEQYKKLLYSNLGLIIQLIKSNNGIVILQDYPVNFYGNSIIKEIGNRYNVPVIDNEGVFEILKSSEKYKKEDYFVEDGHCDARGYGIVADNVYNVLFTKINGL